MTPDALKSLIKPFQTAMFDVEEASARAVLNNLFAPDATLHMCYPFGDLSGPDAFGRPASDRCTRRCPTLSAAI